MTPTEAQVRELLELEGKASIVPWKHDLDKFDDENGIQACVTDDNIEMLATIATGANYYGGCEYDKWTPEMEAEKNAAWSKAKESQALNDAAFIAASRNALRPLAESWLELRDALARMEVVLMCEPLPSLHPAINSVAEIARAALVRR